LKRTKKTEEKLSEQVERKVQKPTKRVPESNAYDGGSLAISTGSTLLDLAISGGRFKEGGIPTGILVEIFGPSGAGKTVLLCQIAGNVQKLGGDIMFHDPEARLNKQFARMFGLNPSDIEYTTPNTIPEVFKAVRKWVPEENDNKKLYGVFADSLAALSTDMELGKDEGDKMGMRRAKEFSEELRKTCRIIAQHNLLMICSNQVRQNLDAGPYGQRYKSPGGEAIGFYSSLRLRCSSGEKIKVARSIHGKEHKRVIGVKTNIEVFKSSVWKPYRTAEVYIIFDYGIDDIRANLKFIKDAARDSIYKVRGIKLGRTLDRAIKEVEEQGLEEELKKQTIEFWNEIESSFEEKRKPRMK
jgi:recombination protein RecA